MGGRGVEAGCGGGQGASAAPFSQSSGWRRRSASDSRPSGGPGPPTAVLPALRSSETRPRTIYSKSEDRERGAPAMENLPFRSLGSSQEELLKMQV